MSLKRTVFCGVILLAIVLAIIILYNGVPWITIFFNSFISKNPPKPQITSGEFPYSITYKINGEMKVLEGKYICRFIGVSWNEGQGKFRKWEGNINNTDETAVLLTEDEMNKVYCYVGSAEYYMGDTESYSGKYPVTPHLFVEKKHEDDRTIWSPEKIASTYEIEIISWSFSKPIQNDFIK